MDNQQLDYIKKLEFNINSLIHDIDILKGFKDKDSNKQLKDKERLVKRLRKDLKDFQQEVRDREAKELEEAQKQQHQLTMEKMDILFKYFAHIGTLKDPKDVDVKLREEFINVKNAGPIRVALRTLLRI